MPCYRYKAVAASSEAIEGRMEAATKSAVVERIHAMGHIPVRVDEVEASPLANLRLDELLATRRMPMRSLALITGQLATLLNAGLALDDALAILEQLVEKRSEKVCLRLLHERISGGATLADAMAAQSRVFPEFYVSMVRAGEAGASLETVLERLADFLERREVTREHIRSALLYPTIVAVTCCISIAILFVFVVPRFRPLFEQSGDALPTSARYLLGLSDLLGSFWWAFILIPLIFVVLILRQLRKPASRIRWERRLLKVPLIGPLIVKIEVACFSRTLGTLLKNGVSLLSALAITRETIRNGIFAEAVATIIDRAEVGKGLAEPLQRTGVFPLLAVHLVRVDEESGRQEEMLFKIADIFETDTRRSIDRLLALLGPALTVVLGLIVAGVIGSILTAVERLRPHDVSPRRKRPEQGPAASPFHPGLRDMGRESVPGDRIRGAADLLRDRRARPVSLSPGQLRCRRCGPSTQRASYKGRNRAMEPKQQQAGEPKHEHEHEHDRRLASSASYVGRQSGFTLIELLVVLAILGLLAALATPQVVKYLGKARADTARIEIKNISSALDLFVIDNGRYPTQQEGLNALVEGPTGLASWRGPYLKTKGPPADPWGRLYQYRYPGQQAEYDLYSLGADNAPGGTGDNEDIANW